MAMEQMPIREEIFQETARRLERHDYYLKMHELRFRTILRAVGPRLPGESRSVLDVGCWPGYLSMYLKATGWDVAAIDLKADRIGDVADCGVRIEERNLNEQPSLPFPDGSFDRIVFTEVLEHLDPDVAPRLFAEFCRTLKPGGLLVTTTPNRFSLNKANLNPFRSREPQVDEEGHGHWKEYSLGELKEFVASAGLEIQVARRISFYAHLGRSDREGYFPLAQWLSHGNRVRNASKHLLRILRIIPLLKDGLVCVARKA